MKNNQNFITMAMFMTLYVASVGASDPQSFEEYENILGDDWNNASDVESSGWEMADELDGNLQAILVDPASMATEEAFQEVLEFIGNDHPESSNSLEVLHIVPSSQRLSKQVLTEHIEARQVNVGPNYKLSNDQDEKRKQEAAIRRAIQREAVNIIREGRLQQYSPEKQVDIKNNANRYNHKSLLDKKRYIKRIEDHEAQRPFIIKNKACDNSTIHKRIEYNYTLQNYLDIDNNCPTKKERDACTRKRQRISAFLIEQSKDLSQCSQVVQDEIKKHAAQHVRNLHKYKMYDLKNRRKKNKDNVDS